MEDATGINDYRGGLEVGQKNSGARGFPLSRDRRSYGEQLIVAANLEACVGTKFPSLARGPSLALHRAGARAQRFFGGRRSCLRG